MFPQFENIASKKTSTLAAGYRKAITEP